MHNHGNMENLYKSQGHVFFIKTTFSGMVIPIVKIRWSWDLILYACTCMITYLHWSGPLFAKKLVQSNLFEILYRKRLLCLHYSDVIMGAMASQITSLTIVYSTVYSGAHQRKHQSSASLAFVWGIHRWPVNSPHKWTVTRKMFAFDDVIM